MLRKNNKYSLILLTVLVLSTAFFSCTEETGSSINPADTTVVEPAVADNTIFVFMPYSGLNSYLYTNINDMLKGIKENKGLGNDKLIIYICESTTRAYLIKARYKKFIQKDTIATAAVLDTLERYNNPDYSSTTGMTTILNKVVSAAPAKRYSMIIGSHGTGWVNGTSWNSPDLLNAKKQFASEYETTNDLGTRAFGGGNHTWIENDSLNKAIDNSNITKPLRYILFDACHMANMETAYELRDVTDYLIGSTCEIMNYGMPYEKIWKDLVGTPDYDAICQGFYDFYLKNSTPYGTISVIDCDECDNMATIMKDINSKCTFTDALDSIQDLDGIRTTIFYDMGDYVKHLCGTNTDLYSRFNSELSLLVPYSRHTNSYYSYFYNTQTVKTIYTFSGITISDLSTNNTITTDIPNTLWYKATH